MKAKPNDPILAEQRMGTVEDAIWESLGANKSHGLRRSNADKRNAVKMALLHPKGVDSSDRQIAKHVGVHPDTVGVIRRELETTVGIRQSNLRQGADGRRINTKNIGTKPSPTANCSQCLNFMDTRGECLVNGSKRTPWTKACDEFEVIPPEPERRELENIPDLPDEYEEIELTRKPVKKNPGRYEHRNTVNIAIPLGDPPLAAAELRFRLGNDYLEQCIIASHVLLRATHDDDPFPHLS
jgi:hypothetical protein